MRVMILADLHFDFWSLDKRDPFEGNEALMKSLDAIVLAGDLTNKPKVRWKYALAHLARFVAPENTFLFPGNHDYYDFRLDDDDRLAEMAADAGVTFAQRKSLVFGTTRLLCATLWTDMALGGDRARNSFVCEQKMNDYRYIRLARGGFRKTSPDDMVRVHELHRSWLESELALPWGGETMVCTHHAPHPDVLNPYPDGVDAAYASDLSALMTGPHAPSKWFFGHVHEGNNRRIGACDLVNVSLGYPDDVADPAPRLRDLVFDL